MATISFDREIRLKPEDMDRFLDVLEKQEKRGDHRHYIDIDDELKESERLLDEYFLLHSQK